MNPTEARPGKARPSARPRRDGLVTDKVGTRGAAAPAAPPSPHAPPVALAEEEPSHEGKPRTILHIGGPDRGSTRIVWGHAWTIAELLDLLKII
jgi:hypothetical protein